MYSFSVNTFHHCHQNSWGVSGLVQFLVEVKKCDILVPGGPCTPSCSPVIKSHLLEVFWKGLFRFSIIGFCKFWLMRLFFVRGCFLLIRINEITIFRSVLLGHGFIKKFLFRNELGVCHHCQFHKLSNFPLFIYLSYLEVQVFFSYPISCKCQPNSQAWVRQCYPSSFYNQQWPCRSWWSFLQKIIPIWCFSYG